MNNNAELPTQYSADVKIEETAQGIRIHVHAYSNDPQEAIAAAFSMYKTCIQVADEDNILRAPMEIKEKK